MTRQRSRLGNVGVQSHQLATNSRPLRGDNADDDDDVDVYYTKNGDQ